MFRYLAFIVIISTPVIIYSVIHRRMLKSRLKYKLFPSHLILIAFGFFIFEIFAINNQWWSFNNASILGFTIASVPIEELAFFILIPQLCLFLWALLKVKHPWENLCNMSKHHIKGRADE